MVQRREIVRILAPVAKALISVGLIFVVLRIVDLKKLKETLVSISLVHFFFAAFFMFLIIALAAYRWRLCILPQGIDIRVGKTFNYSLIGFFFNNLAPSTVGGDVAKGVMVSRFFKTKPAIVISILIDRLIGLLATGILALIALVVSFNLPLDNRIRFVIVLFACIVTALLLLIFNKPLSSRIGKVFSSLRLTGIGDKFASISGSISVYLAYPKVIKKTLAISILMQVTNIFISYILALGLDIKLSFSYFFIFIPLIMAVMSIPVSLNGIGLREGAYVVFFSLAGVSREGALAISTTYYAVVLAVSLVGGVLFLLSLRERRR